ncbi:V-ATPase V0 sector subunit c'' [Coemansia sp. RSA 2320]|nr:V-ATPase V0 sector subunit c'' [Coemansia sp. RSA 2320]
MPKRSAYVLISLITHMLAQQTLGKQARPAFVAVARAATAAASRRRWRSSVSTTQHGGPVGNLAHRVYFARGDKPISPWHDIPLLADAASREYNMVCEVPRWSNAKLEIDTKAPFNPIKQDSKKGRPRYVADVFPYKGYIWNYGALPQTFEDPDHRDADTGCLGDSDPVDVVEVGQAICAEGSVHRIKVLGLLALIDGGETDWKVFAIRADDPLASKVNSVSCLDRYMPGLVNATVDWFSKYKVPDGKPLNGWAFDGEPRDAQSPFALANVTVRSSPHCLLADDASDMFRTQTTSMLSSDQVCADTANPQMAPPGAKWYYVRGDAVANGDD